MKNVLIKMSFLTTITLGLSASAMQLPTGTERPLFEISGKNVQIQSQSIEAVKNIELQMMRRDGSKDATSFSFKADFFANKIADTQSFEFFVTEITHDACGSTIYHASTAPKAPAPNYQILPVEDTFHVALPKSERRVKLRVIDHSTRLCEDYKSYAWEVELHETYEFSANRNTVVEFLGNPEPVYTIQQYIPEI